MLSVASRRVPNTIATRAALVRTYSSSIRDGSVAQTKDFGRKERAHEEEYTRRHDAELLRKLKNQIEQKKKELADLESKVKDTESK